MFRYFSEEHKRVQRIQTITSDHRDYYSLIKNTKRLAIDSIHFNIEHNIKQLSQLEVIAGQNLVAYWIWPIAVHFERHAIDSCATDAVMTDESRCHHNRNARKLG